MFIVSSDCCNSKLYQSGRGPVQWRGHLSCNSPLSFPSSMTHTHSSQRSFFLQISPSDPHIKCILNQPLEIYLLCFHIQKLHERNPIISIQQMVWKWNSVELQEIFTWQHGTYNKLVRLNLSWLCKCQNLNYILFQPNYLFSLCQGKDRRRSIHS